MGVSLMILRSATAPVHALRVSGGVSLGCRNFLGVGIVDEIFVYRLFKYRKKIFVQILGH